MKRLSKFLALFSPPGQLSFEQSQKYRILQYALVVAALIALPIGWINYTLGDIDFASLLLAFAILNVLGLYLNHRRKYNLAAFLLSVQFFTAIVFTIVEGLGFNDTGIVAFPIFIIFTAFILGRKGLLGALVCSIAFIAGLYIFDRSGLLVLRVQPSLNRVILLSLLTLMAAAIVWGILETWERSLIERSRSEAHFRSLFEDSPVSLWELDASALKHYLSGLPQADWRAYLAENPEAVRKCVDMVKVREVNRATLDLLDYASKEDMLANIPQVFTDSTYQAFLDTILCLAKQETCYESETALKNRAGEDVYVNLRVSVPEGFGESWSSAQLSLTDISRRRQAELRLIESEARYRTLAQATFEGIVLSENGVILDANEQFAAMNRYTRQEVIGKKLLDFLLPEDQERVKGVIARGEEMLSEYHGIRSDGTTFNAEAHGRTYEFGQKKVRISSIRDITERKRAEEGLRLEAARSKALARTAARLNAQLEIDKVLESICQEIVEVMNVPAASVLLYDPQQDACVLAAEHGFPREFAERFQPLSRASLVGAQATRQTVITIKFRNYQNMANGRLFADYKIATLLGIGIFHKEQFLGVVDVYCTNARRNFSEDEMSLLKALTDLGSQAIVNARLYREVSEGREYLRRVSQQLVEVQEAERQMLALELHDELGQTLNGIKISLDMIPIIPEAATREQLLGKARAAMGGLIEKVRQMSLDLRPSLLDEMGLLPTLRWLFRSYQEQTRAQVQFSWEGPEGRLPPPVEITAYRIVQEALNNVIRHVQDKNVAVTVRMDGASLHLRIEDQGEGFDAQKELDARQSTGLSGMRERARLLGGELKIASLPGTGTTISASLPLVAT